MRIKDEMELGKIVKLENDVPQMEVKGTSIRDARNPHTYYLSPFRGYGFQVSRDVFGQMNVGSSSFIGLDNVIKSCSSSTIALEMFRLMAYEALERHAKMYEEKWIMSMTDELALNEFVDECYEWMLKEMKEATERQMKQKKRKVNINLKGIFRK